MGQFLKDKEKLALLPLLLSLTSISHALQNRDHPLHTCSFVLVYIYISVLSQLFSMGNPASGKLTLDLVQLTTEMHLPTIGQI